jgi:DNA-binding HxlR family transcriptional regulator
LFSLPIHRTEQQKFGLTDMNVRVTLKIPSLASVSSADCVLQIVRGRWAVQIISQIGGREALHFGALKRAIPGISSKVLTEQLRRFEQAGILQRKRKPAARPEMLYSLTNRGHELKTVLDCLQELGSRWQHEDASAIDRAD